LPTLRLLRYIIRHEEKEAMSTLTFGTLQLAQRLKKTGIQGNEAEAIAEAVRDAQVNANIATKRDVSILETRIAETKAELIKWVVNAGELQTAMIAALSTTVDSKRALICHRICKQFQTRHCEKRSTEAIDC
jgi:hypothetical protein